MTVVSVGRRRVEVTHPDKVLFPDDGITKAELVAYYRRVAPLMLPHVRGRPVMLQRFPDGIRAGGFYQKQVSDYFPAWLHRVTVGKAGGSVTHAVCDDQASIVYLASQACVTPHAWLSKADDLDHPDQLMFDLDPSGDDFDAVREAALELRECLAELGLACFVKTSGSRGLHVVVGLDRRADFDAVRAFARRVAERLVARRPDRLTLEARKGERGGRLLIDIARNAYSQTAVAPYGVRALPGAPVAVPLAWAEVERGGFGPRGWTLRNVFERLEAVTDPWAGLVRSRQSLGPAEQRLAGPAR
jgi:bifunctional non-homologous end joining protein LigD